jgi:hypothetical protein
MQQLFRTVDENRRLHLLLGKWPLFAVVGEMAIFQQFRSGRISLSPLNTKQRRGGALTLPETME